MLKLYVSTFIVSFYTYFDVLFYFLSLLFFTSVVSYVSLSFSFVCNTLSCTMLCDCVSPSRVCAVTHAPAA